MPVSPGEYNEFDQLVGENDAIAASANSSFASQAEAEAGTNSVRLMSPLRTAQAIAALATVAAAHGIKVYASGAALIAGTPDYAGQLAISTDGAIGIGFNTSAGGFVSNGVSILNPALYLGSIRSTVTGAFIDNAIDVQNTSETGAAEGYSAIAFWHHDETIDNGRALAVGIGPNVAGEYGNRCYIATNPIQATPTNQPPDIGIWQERDDGSGYIAHRRIFFDGTAHSITIYGWSTTLASGPIGWHVHADGRVSVGGNTPQSGKALTVTGDLYVSGKIVAPTQTVSTTADVGRNTTTTYAVDGSLSIPVTAGEVIVLRAKIDVITGAGGIKLKWDSTGVITSVTTRGYYMGYEQAPTTVFANTGEWATGFVSDDAVFFVDVKLIVGTTGAFGLYWAQNVSDAASSYVNSGSYLEVVSRA